MGYVFHLIIIICIYSILSQSLSLSCGYSGQVSLSHVAFYGIGAYTTALLSLNFGFPPILNMAIAICLSIILGFIIERAAVNIEGDLYVVFTMGIQIVIFSAMNNCQNLTNGPLGLSGIPQFNLFGLIIDNKFKYSILCFLICSILFIILKDLCYSPFGRLLRGINDDSLYISSIGKDVKHAKTISFIISGAMASIAGVLYAHYISYIDPTCFTIDESIFILSIVIIGGLTKLESIFLVTIILVLLPELLRFVGMPANVAANVKQILYGAFLILSIIKRDETQLITEK